MEETDSREDTASPDLIIPRTSSSKSSAPKIRLSPLKHHSEERNLMEENDPLIPALSYLEKARESSLPKHPYLKYRSLNLIPPLIRPQKRCSSRRIVIPISTDDIIDVDIVRAYIAQPSAAKDLLEGINSNLATNGSESSGRSFSSDGDQRNPRIDFDLDNPISVTFTQDLQQHQDQLEQLEGRTKQRENVLEFNKELEWRYEKGINKFNTAKTLQKQSQLASALKNCIEGYNVIHDHFLMDCKKRDREAYEKCVKIKIECKLKASELQFGFGNTQETFREANQIIKEIDENCAEAYYLRGLSQQEKNKIQSIIDFKKAAELCPEETKYEERLKECKIKLIKRKSSDPSCYKNIQVD